MVFYLRKGEFCMKKVWFIVLFFLSLVVLAGCQAEEASFVVEIKDLSGDLISTHNINYPEDTTLSVFELMDEELDIDYSTSQWGVMINGIEGFYPQEYGITYNYYLGLYVNDEMSMVGIDQITYEEDMVISFIESTMLSELDMAIDQWLFDFSDAYRTEYISTEGINQYVLSALVQLDLYGYTWASLDGLTYPPLVNDTIGNQFRTALIEKTFGLATGDTEAALLALTPANPYEAVTYMNTLDLLFGDASSEKRMTVANYLVNNLPEYMDADYAGMALGAISSIQNEVLVQTYQQNMIDYIKNAQTKDGITSWGSANASSTSQAIIGLYAVGEDPRGESYTKEDIDLVEALMTFIGEDGFKYLLNDENDDMAFSSPQAFAALALYKIYRDQHYNWSSPVLNLWHLSINE
jgi:hypothetical protein